MDSIQEQINHNFVNPTHFSQIPNIAVIDLTPNEFILYGAYLRTIWNNQSGACWKSQKTLADEIGYSVPTLRKSRNGLAKKGYIQVTSGADDGKTDVITLISKWEENHNRAGGMNDNLSTPQKESLHPPAKNVSTPQKESLHKEESFNKTKTKKTKILTPSNDDVPQKPTTPFNELVESDKIIALIHAWVEQRKAHGSPVAGNPYGRPDYRAGSKAMVKLGIEPKHVTAYTKHLQDTDTWYEARAVDFKKVIETCKLWVDKVIKSRTNTANENKPSYFKEL